ncbi:MAG TPA: YqaJ viral recombinase family protein [Candidatus Manganitrophaceae bacterium]|nr:YqaJ viral recombinase family protein [Candidatus Manganitrophaceae bacterium]
MNGLSYTIVPLEQGTSAWLAWRGRGIGASDAPTIMGENPWKSAAQLLKEKCEGRSGGPNAAMARGTALEPEARKHYERRSGLSVVPACLQSVKHEWLRASVDGLCVEGSAVVEIKCGESVYRNSAMTRKVPDYYVGQLQHILAVTGLPSIDFWCYLPGRPEVHLKMARDDGYIKRLLEEEALFWRQIVEQRGAGSKQTASAARPAEQMSLSFEGG